jgi:hypothetical protein
LDRIIRELSDSGSPIVLSDDKAATPYRALADLVANSIAINDPAIKNEEHDHAKI